MKEESFRIWVQTRLVLLFLLAVAFVFCFAVKSSFGADGDTCDLETGMFTAGLSDRRGVVHKKCVKLCDGDTSPGTCDILDLMTKRGIPDVLKIEIFDHDSCSGAFAVAISSRESTVSTSTWHVRDTLSVSNTVVVILKDAFMGRYIRGVTSNLGDCTGFDVFVHSGFFK